jgi:hypothetical protein
MIGKFLTSQGEEHEAFDDGSEDNAKRFALSSGLLILKTCCREE